MKWIPVAEQLPEAIYSVVVWVVRGRLVVESDKGYMDVGIYNTRESRWQVADPENDDDEVVEVSHWIDVPKPWEITEA